MAKSADIRVGGLTPLTTIDYPNHLAAVIYCQGCPWQCRYCHNPELIDCKAAGDIAWQDVLQFLEKRQGLLDAVVFSGGEPLMQSGLPETIKSVKQLGFKVGLHTGGAVAKRFKQVLPLIDWVGFDVKGLIETADQITGVKGSAKANWHGLDLLLDSGVNYQCRTTVHWSLLSATQLMSLATRLNAKGVTNYSVQIARTTDSKLKTLDPNLGVNRLPIEQAVNLRQRLAKHFTEFSWITQ